jgi:hypothetical protein
VKVSRRMFLQGSGGLLLGIPTLSSLLTRDARSQEPSVPIRYVQWITDHGQYIDRFWPAARPTQEVAPGVKSRRLSEITGPLSQVLDASFDPIRNKINLVRGLDLMVAKNFHNACVPTCGSWPREDNHIPFFAHSVDSVLETSTKVYPTPTRVPALRLTPGVNSGYKWGSFSWTTRNGKPFKLPALETTQTALEAVFGTTTGGPGSPTVDPVIAQRKKLTDQVMADYRSVVGSRSLSAADRQLLNDYMDLLTELQTRMTAEPPKCTPPAQLTGSDFEILHKNAADIVVAALLCGSTRVVAYHCYQGSATLYDEETFHAWAHDDASKHAPMQNWRYRQFAHLVSRMDSVTDVNGRTLLDNSLVYCGNELSDPGHGGTHLQSMPVLTAGSAGGKLVTGEYIDFGARLMNNLLVTIFNVMGLGPADYERNGVAGFGDYEGNRAEVYAQYVSTEARRSALPYLHRG